MTEHGGKIPALTKERVREQLTDERDPKAIKRLTAAREYLEGLSPAQIEDKYGWSRQTIYNWLNRFEERGFDPRSTMIRDLDAHLNLTTNSSNALLTYSKSHRQRLATTSPSGAVTSFNSICSKNSTLPTLNATFDESCTRPGSPRRDPGRSQPVLTKPNERSSTTPLKKVGHRDRDATVVTLDQTRKAVRADLYRGWSPVGERPTVTVSASREGVNLLGAVTEHGQTEVLECSGSFTGEVTVRFLSHLQERLGERLIVLLDKATYFTAEAVKNFAAEEPIELVYFPTGSPDLNPTEEYWRRLKLALGNQYFATVEELRSAVWAALDTISPPGSYQYLCP